MLDSRKAICIAFLLLLLIEFCIASPSIASGLTSNDETSSFLFKDDFVNVDGFSSSSVMADVPLGYMGSPRTSWVILFYNPSQKKFTFRFNVRWTGLYYEDQVVKSAVTGFYVAFSLYYSDTEAYLKDSSSKDIVYSSNYAGSIDEIKEYYLSGEPRWSYLKWNFLGFMWGQTWDSVKAEMDSKDADWWYQLYQWGSAVVFIVGLAAVVVASGGTMAVLLPEIISYIVIDGMIKGVIQDFGALLVYKIVKGELERRKDEGYWSALIIGVDDLVQRDPNVNSISVNGPGKGEDTRDIAWENTRGPYELGDYTVYVKAYRVNKLKIEFTTPDKGSEIYDTSLVEGDPYGSPYKETLYKVRYQKEAVSRSLNDQFYSLMKHDDFGNPYFEFRFHASVNYEVSTLRENDEGWVVNDYTEGQDFKASATGWGAGASQVVEKTSEMTTKVKIVWRLAPSVRKKFEILIMVAVFPLYLIYEKTKTIAVVIPYPPYQNPKYLLAHPPHMPEREEYQYVGPQPPPEHILLDIPDPSYRYIIAIPQVPSGQDWKATLAYDPDFSFHYGTVVSIPSTVADDQYIAVQVYIPALDKYLTVNKPSPEEVLAVTTASPTNTMFIVPVLPAAGERAVIDLINPDTALLVTAQTTSAYPLKISLNDIPRTTFVKIPSGGDLDLRVLKAGYGPSLTISDNQLGIYVNSGVVSSSFEYYFKRRIVAHGTVDVPPSVTLTVDDPNSGLTFTEDGDHPKISATLQNLISAVIQLVGHGVDLSYTYATGTNNFKLIVRNIGVVRDTFNLTVVEKPTFSTVTLGANQVTLDPGMSTEVDLSVTTTSPFGLISPKSSSHMMGVNEALLSGGSYVKVKAVCNAKPEVFDTAKVPVAMTSLFKAEVTMGNTSVNSTTSSSFKDTFIKLIGNVTVEAGGRLDFDNSTVVVEPEADTVVRIVVLDGGEINLNDTDVSSKDEEHTWDFEIRGLLTVARKAKLKNGRVKLLRNLEVSLGSRLILSNSLFEVGGGGITPTITVHQGGFLNLLNSTLRSFSPSNPYNMRGGGKIVSFESETKDFLRYVLKIETVSHSLHIRYPEVADYTITVTNSGNLTDQIALSLEQIPPTIEWQAWLDQTFFTLTPGQTAVTLLHVRSLTPMPSTPILEVDVRGQSFNDPEVSYSLKTFTKKVEPQTQPYIDLDSYDTYLRNENPIEEETVGINAAVHNDGDQTAFNVQVTFFDQTVQQTIDTVYVPQVPARSFLIVEAQWDIQSASLHLVETSVYYPQGAETITTDFQVKAKPKGTSAVMIDEDPPLIAYTGQPIYFDAFNFTDVDGNIVEFLWDFGNGSQGAGQLVVYSYWSDGTFDVTLRVIDDFGAETTKTAQITILNRPPTASFTADPSSAWLLESITFNATASLDIDGSITAYQWDFGDLSSDQGMVVTHQYGAVGTYNVTLTVTDNDGANSTYQAAIDVLNAETLIYDVGIMNLILPSEDPDPGAAVQTNATAANFGNLHSPQQTFNVTLYLIRGSRITLLGEQTVILDGAQTTTITFNVKFRFGGAHDILVIADQVPNEEYLENNAFSFLTYIFAFSKEAISPL